MQSDEEKADEILKKRRLAAMGLKVRSDGKPVDPLADMTSLDPDDKTPDVDPLDHPAADVAKAAALARAK